MAVSLNELGDIMRKNRKWRDIGGVRENTRAATIMKIIYALAKEPLTKERIHRATGIHKGTVLDTALHVAKRKNLVFEHKPTINIRYYSAHDPLITKAYGYTYYLLNWSNPDAKKLFAVYRDHRGWGDNWSGIYFSDYIRFEELDKKLGLDKLDFSKLYEAAGLSDNGFDKERDEVIFREKIKEFSQIGNDTVTIIMKHKEEVEKEWEGTGVAKQPDTMKRIVLNTLIHLKIQGIIPNETYRIPYVYVDVWKRLEKEGLLDFAAATE